MFSVLRNTALAAITGLALTSPARATWLVDFNSPGFGNGGAHVEFFTPTFLTSDTISIFNLDIGGVTGFQYDLGSGPAGGCTDFVAFAVALLCVGASLSGLHSAEGNVLTPTGNPDVYDDAVSGGSLTFTALAAVPEPASLTLLAVGLAGLGMVRRYRRT